MNLGSGSLGSWRTCECGEHFAKELDRCPKCGRTHFVEVTKIVRPTIDGPQPDRATAEEEKWACGHVKPGTDNSLVAGKYTVTCELAPGHSGDHRRYGSHWPNISDDKRPDVTARQTPGGISKRAAEVRRTLADVDAVLNRRLDQITGWLRGEKPLAAGSERAVAAIYDHKHRQNFGKAARTLEFEAAKIRSYPHEQERQALRDAAQAFREAQATMMACGNRLTEATDAQGR